jgi:FkbM family methyltransferase
MQPTPHIATVPIRQPFGRRVIEAITERRLPYRFQARWDRVCVKLGVRERTLYRKGMRFRVRRESIDETLVTNVAVNREYNKPAGYEIMPGDLVIDIGGNIGSFAVLASPTAMRVIVVEPNADNFRLLEKNLRLNRCKNVTAIEAAVSDKDGREVLFCVAEDAFGSHSIMPDRQYGEGRSVKAIRLDTLMSDQDIDRCDFLKIDCEGAENLFLHSLPAECFARIRRIAMEWHGTFGDHDQSIAQGCKLAERLLQNGFHIDSFTFDEKFFCGFLFASLRCRPHGLVHG